MGIWPAEVYTQASGLGGLLACLLILGHRLDARESGTPTTRPNSAIMPELRTAFAK